MIGRVFKLTEGTAGNLYTPGFLLALTIPNLVPVTDILVVELPVSIIIHWTLDIC